MVELGLQIMLADVAGQLQFLQLGCLLVFADFFLPLLAFKAVSAEIHNFAYRRLALRRDLDEVKPRFKRHPKRLLDAEHADLLARRVDHADFLRLNLFVD